jgi:Rrf2 family cysteine metabolism transcriptional repressor
MKLTNKSEYALLALVALARNYSKGLLSGELLAEQQRIPKRFLQQILFALKHGGFVRSVKGKSGGYMLARDPAQISVAEIVRFFEGPLAPTTSVSRNYYQPSPIEHEQGLVSLFAKIRDCVAELLEVTTLAEVSLKPLRKRKA